MELAKRFNGEIINGDAMQMYNGLPIITNKIPEAEREGVPHHLLDVIGYDEQPWDVRKFTRESQQMVEDIHARGRLPILVGGTHYYTLSLLFQDSLVFDSNLNTQSEHGDSAEQWPILASSTEEILAKLRVVDPVMANRWHPNDHRKIRRSLEIWYQTGKPASQIYLNQAGVNGGPANRDKTLLVNDDVVGSRLLRYPTIVFWLQAEKEILNSRLNARLDKMILEGLIEEASLLHRFTVERRSNGIQDDMTQGDLDRDRVQRTGRIFG